MPTLNHGRCLLILATTSVVDPSSMTSGSSLLPTAGKSLYYILAIRNVTINLMANIILIIFFSLSLFQPFFPNCSLGRSPHLDTRGHRAVHVCGCHLLACRLWLPDPGQWHHADETGTSRHREPVRQTCCPAQSLPYTRGYVHGVRMGKHLLWSRWVATKLDIKSHKNLWLLIKDSISHYVAYYFVILLTHMILMTHMSFHHG